jgi:hypothetical protein
MMRPADGSPSPPSHARLALVVLLVILFCGWAINAVLDLGRAEVARRTRARPAQTGPGSSPAELPAPPSAPRVDPITPPAGQVLQRPDGGDPPAARHGGLLPTQ